MCLMATSEFLHRKDEKHSPMDEMDNTEIQQSVHLSYVGRTWYWSSASRPARLN